MSNLPWSEDYMLRQSHSLYDEWELGDEPEQDRDVFAEAEALWELEQGR